jgi:hypothetical protein
MHLPRDYFARIARISTSLARLVTSFPFALIVTELTGEYRGRQISNTNQKVAQPGGHKNR